MQEKRFEKIKTLLQEQKYEEKVGVAWLDADGCFYYGIYDKPDDVPFEKWIIEKNKDILDALIKKYSDGYSKVVLGYITNRQSYLTDKRNGGTCTPLLPILQDYLQSKLKCEVVMDPFWSADIYANKKNGGDKQAGDSYKLALKNHFSDPELKDKHPEEVFDKTKGTLLYALTKITMRSIWLI